MIRVGFLALFVFAVSARLSGAEGERSLGEGWRLIFEDQMTDAAIKPEWLAVDARRPANRDSLRLDDGWLGVTGTASALLLTIPAGDDVRVFWESKCLESVGESMTQHSVFLHAHALTGNMQPVALVHGRSRGTTNTIEFPSLTGRVAKNADPLPKVGETYSFEARIDGLECALFRDGEEIIRAELPFDLRGGGFENVMFPVIPEGSFIRNVRVYVRGKPVVTFPELTKRPEGPFANLADAASIAGPDERLAALLELARDPHAGDYGELLAAIGQVLADHPELDPKVEGQWPLTFLVDRMIEVNGPRSIRRDITSLWLANALPPSNPFRSKVLLDGGRGWFWAYLEGGRNPEKRTVSDALFSAYRLVHPDDPVAKVYLGEEVLWEPALAERTDDVPAWAQSIREAYQRSLAVLRWWSTQPMAADGSLTGNWGDDVELMRTWAPIAQIHRDPASLGLVLKLIDGAWEDADGGLELGYSKRVWDVEHSSEPTADTQPWGLVLAPNDPKYVERNAMLVPLTRDLWTAVSPMGYRRFKSVWFSAEEVDDSAGFRGDVPYANRAFKGITWLAAAGKLSDQDRQLWLDLCAGWREATLRDQDPSAGPDSEAKIAGVVPSAVSYDTDRLGGPGTWYASGIPPQVLYTFNKNNQERTLGLLVSAYVESGDTEFLAPIFAGLEAAERFVGDAEPRAYTRSWQEFKLKQFRDEGVYARPLFRYRRVSGDVAHDDYLRGAAPLLAWHLDGDAAAAGEAIEQILEHPDPYQGDLRLDEAYLAGLRYNFIMLTSEVLSSDRALIPGVRLLYGMMTGASGLPQDGAAPDAALTWEHASGDFAALVRSPRDTGLVARLVNFDPAVSEMGLVLSSLQPGRYRLEQSLGDGEWETVDEIDHRENHVGRAFVDAPARKEVLLRVTPISDGASKSAQPSIDE